MSRAAPEPARRQASGADAHRPRCHFTPPANWMNDPNGLIEWGGRYHLFYQYNPHGPRHGSIHWGHAVSGDLVHWEDWPVALAPDPAGPDPDGCWSGCALDNAGVPTLVYTAASPQTVCVATGSADLRQWTKHPANPVLAGPPGSLNTGGDFRDPYVWGQEGDWHMLLGARLERVGGAVLHYQSADLMAWRYQGVLLQGDRRRQEPFAAGAVWECPNLIPLGDRHVLLISVVSNDMRPLNTVYFAGEFGGLAFAPTSADKLVHGASFYAPQVMRLSHGRMVMWGWLREERPQSALDQAGWAGAMSVPIALSWLPEGRLGMTPVEELRSLRRAGHRWADVELGPGAELDLRGVQGDSLELEAVLELAPDAEVAFSLLRSPGGEEQTEVLYAGRNARLSVAPCGAEPPAAGAEREAPVPLGPDGRLHLRIFLDCSAVEVFANGHVCVAARQYPRRPDSQGVAVACRAGRARVASLDVWELASIW